MNEHLKVRVNGIFEMLVASYNAGIKMSSATKGLEREVFVKNLLSRVFPAHYRFASGDVIDYQGHHSGQLDIVLEFPQRFSLPLLDGDPRLYIAEKVAAVIEVKSSLSNQWDEVTQKSKMLAEIQRRYVGHWYKDLAETRKKQKYPNDEVDAILGEAKQFEDVSRRIPFFVVGFDGWEETETIQDKFVDQNIDGIFQINSRKFVYGSGSFFVEDEWSMVFFLEYLEEELFKYGGMLPIADNYQDWFKPVEKKLH